VYAKNLQTTILIRHTNVYLAIKSAKAAKSSVNRIGPIRCANDDYVRASFKPIHERQQLRNDSALHLALSFLALRRNGINLINEDDGLSQQTAQWPHDPLTKSTNDMC